ncbi:sulfate-transporting ATPase [[Clostridium] sordellii]|uniref:ABC transporter ATP-binding protein n=1 Tax=Paraclostridium sordellii TaxID=1505 RepID=UPI0005DC1BD0|nr:ABC transporter ATP-binding protein [Paeniclostridium sordellii]AUN14204.1 ABC transporter ATP-binding protein [Paeniclostridium sordellii]MDU1455426.1 ABC transporter ATP-binding protein [Paeniclostridium sordellii]CEO05737.1 sulfate-transporting ATPase [[Clostridium] sordellii] [Paeniclostridium sordellii]CEP40618.1 sulfate-transporting ATPase [[Clostridium] sordellii] [Paeniclostridium sordellii]CEP48406.1 sulfate-transporting ATPase [[Clostridium] sordellii] [Paeniclostridium sordellii]
MNSKVKVSNLQKKYNNNTVLKGISFDVDDGTIFALLGTNGAGKTTTLECMEGILKHSSDQIYINGKIGVQLQSSSLPEGIKAIEALKLFAMWNSTIVDIGLIDRLGLTGILKKQYKEMSTGQKRRLHLALAMTGDPDVIFLDEPTAGLDVEGRVALHEEIKRLKNHGKTIIISSHDMAEVEALCDKLAILKDGEIAFLGTVDELKSNVKNIYTIMLNLSSQIILDECLTCCYKGKIQDYYIFESNEVGDGLLELLTVIKNQNIDVYDIKIEHSSLEECFIDIARGNK